MSNYSKAWFGKQFEKARKKVSCRHYVTIINCFFNLVLESGILPDALLECVIKPIYINKVTPSSGKLHTYNDFGKPFTRAALVRIYDLTNSYS